MQTLIVTYSRTGTTMRAVQALADLLGAEIAQIHCRRYVGRLGAVLAVFDSLLRRRPSIEVRQIAKAPELMVLAAPVWVGRVAAPLVAFLAKGPKLPARVALLLTHQGSDPTKAFAEVEALIGRPAAARLALKEADVKADNISEGLAEFARK